MLVGMRPAELQRLLRTKTLYCRFNLRLRVRRRINESLLMDHLLGELSKYGEVLYEKSNEKFVLGAGMPPKLDLAITSPHLVTLMRFITNIRGYEFENLEELGIEDTTESSGPRQLEELERLFKELNEKRDRNKGYGSLRVPSSPFIFSNHYPSKMKTLNGDLLPTKLANTFSWTYQPVPADKSGSMKYHYKFLDYPSKKNLLMIDPCVFANLSELPNEMNEWLRSSTNLTKAENDRLSTLFHGFSGF